jgi:hypothetical protein
MDAPNVSQLLQRLANRIEARESTQSRTGSPVLDNLLRSLLETLDKHPHFTGEVREDFLDLLVQTLYFLRASRESQRGDFADRFRYLFRGEGSGAGGQTLERALADDFVTWLSQGPLASRIYCEVATIGGGRVDILVTHGSHRFVCEVKREETDVTRDGISRYLRQEAQYQTVDVALGMLLVLDLTERAYDRHVESSAWVELLQQATDLERGVVVALIEGNRQSPSQLSR